MERSLYLPIMTVEKENVLRLSFPLLKDVNASRLVFTSSYKKWDSWLRQLSFSTGDIIFLLIMWFSNFDFFLFDSTVWVTMSEGMNQRQEISLIYMRFQMFYSINTVVTNNLHPFLKTLEESRVISSHFLRRCTSLTSKNPNWTEIFIRLFESERSICIRSYEVLTSDIKLRFTINSWSLR